MRSLLARINEGRVVTADGATGSLLIEHGLEPGAAPESLNLTRPDALRAVTASYIEAGAEIVHTNTFGGSPLKLAAHGLDARTEEINRAAVLAARDAVEAVLGDPTSPPRAPSCKGEGRGEATAQREIFVSGSVGPSGCMLAPYGDTEPEAALESFERQIAALVSSGIDALTTETMIDLAEAKLAVRAARRVSTTIPVMATMTFDVLPRGAHTIMGNDVPTCALELIDEGADVVGSNCGNGSETMLAIAREFHSATGAPLLFQPNAGLPHIENGLTVFDETPEQMAARALEFADLGASVLGGCCGTTPAHIRALRAALR